MELSKGMLLFEGEVFKISEVKTNFEKVNGQETTKITGFTQEVALFVPAKLDDFDKVAVREQVLQFRVWASKSTDDRFMPVGLIGVVKIGAYLEGRRFVKTEDVNGVPAEKEMFFLSLNLSRFKLLKATKARPVLNAKISEGTVGQDELPF